MRIHASSGTRGKPTVVGYTRHDLERLVRSHGPHAGDGRRRHRAWSSTTRTATACSPAAWGSTWAPNCSGCTVVPISGGLSQRQVLLLEDLGGQVLCCTPSYALNIAQTLVEHGIGRDRLKLEVGIFGAEPWTEQMRDEIERQLGSAGAQRVRAVGDCRARRVGRVHRGPQRRARAGRPLPGRDHRSCDRSAAGPGEEGELVFTTLTKEALPMLRYRTGDISSLDVDAVRVRAHHGAHGAGARPLSTTCSSSAA